MAASVRQIQVQRVERSRIETVDFSNLPFGTLFSDHMLVAEYRDGKWNEPSIRPYGPLSLPPNISALQYGISIFEGLKAHRSASRDILIFRPRDNARRLNRSSARLAMPELPEEFFVEGLRALVGVDQQWVPDAEQGSLSHIKRIDYRGRDLILSDVEKRTIGPRLRERLVRIMTGRDGNPYGWTEPVHISAGGKQ